MKNCCMECMVCIACVLHEAITAPCSGQAGNGRGNFSIKDDSCDT